MLEISVKEVRKNLSHWLSKAEHGNEIVITRRGKRVAKMVSSISDNALPRLGDFRKKLNVSGISMSDMVIENRRSERY